MKLIMLKNCYVDGVPRKIGETVETDKWKVLVGTGSAIRYVAAATTTDAEPKLVHRAKRGQP